MATLMFSELLWKNSTFDEKIMLDDFRRVIQTTVLKNLNNSLFVGSYLHF